MPIVKLTSS
ncbi:Protein of unknown function [Pyronema omphalodes CBS 100304]|uniref:Uncharacterized protein n=1 Tax=Pyronema omphalodes (strain CBS 100304) TaxID=1076935 RepID=U4LSN3_PYROM|nr:Protein of unknown function [Pyronema omphalodes CBS 100304]